MSLERKNLIITADDFGASEKANQRILELAKLGKIDRVAVMADGVFSQSDISNLLNSGIKLDVHLDLFGGINEQGKSVAIRLVKFMLGWISSKGRSKNVAIDWERQIEKFKTILGKYPDGINSHQHIHFFPPYFKITLKLAKKYNIPYFRYGNFLIAEKFSPVFWMLRFLRIFIKNSFASSGLKTSQYLVSFEWIKNPENFLKNKENVELVCHPEKDGGFEEIKNL